MKAPAARDNENLYSMEELSERIFLPPLAPKTFFDKDCKSTLSETNFIFPRATKASTLTFILISLANEQSWMKQAMRDVYIGQISHEH